MLGQLPDARRCFVATLTKNGVFSAIAEREMMWETMADAARSKITCARASLCFVAIIALKQGIMYRHFALRASIAIYGQPVAVQGTAVVLGSHPHAMCLVSLSVS